MFENAIQACADLAKHVATRDFGWDGSSSKEAITVLANEGVIEETTADTLVSAIGFRNVLAHEYGKVDAVEVFDTLQTGLGVYNSYSREVATWYQTDRDD